MGEATALSDGITAQLRSHMQSRGITSFRALAAQAQVSPGQVRRLRRGQVAGMQLQKLQQLAEALGLDLLGLLALASFQANVEPDRPAPAGADGAALRAECDRLQRQLRHQATELRQSFEQESLYQLEPWMKNWPRVVHAVQTDRPDLAAAKILPLVKPVEQLLQSWGVTAIGAVGDRLAYDPQQHQLLRGQAEPGQEVTVTRPGYRQGDRLLHRAEVKAP